MDLFSFLLVVVAIVLGLGITELLGGVVRILRGDLKRGALHTLWVLIVFQLQLQLAWGLWGLRGRTEWRYPEFVLLLLGPVTLYMAAAVLFPSVPSDQTLDHHLLRRRRAFFLLNAGYVVVTGLFSWFLFHEGWLPGVTLLRLGTVAVLLTLAKTNRRSIHWAFGILILAAHLWWTYIFTFVASATRTGP
jgi:hypothetical protein